MEVLNIKDFFFMYCIMGAIQSIRSKEHLCVCIRPSSYSSHEYTYELMTCNKIDENSELRTCLQQNEIEKDIIEFNKSYIFLGSKELVDTYINSKFAIINDTSNTYEGFINRLINGIIIAYKDFVDNNIKNETN
jgi:hypothetical protein